MNEELLHFIWQHKLYKAGLYVTSNQKSMEVVHPGLPNSDAGPDFFNAKIKLDGILWAGNVEIHFKSSDWRKHQHHQDLRYDNVVLHVVLKNDEKVFSTSGRAIPAWEMEIPQTTFSRYQTLYEHKGFIACENQINQIDGFEIDQWIERMLVEKLEAKVNGIVSLLETYQNDWLEVFYILLARNFGFGLNGDLFEQLARQTPWKITAHISDAPEKLEALFLGQGGFLEGLVFDDDYITLLAKEYRILKQKYALEAVSSHLWKFLRLRPVNFPTIRLVQLAALIAKNKSLFEQLLHCDSLKTAVEQLKAEPAGYWTNHYRPCVPGTKSSKKLGQQAVDLIIINTVIPLFFAYGKLRDKPMYQQKALDWLFELPPEKNRVVKKWAMPGVDIKARSAAQTQGLVFLKNNYCDNKKCLHCRIGHQLLSKHE